MAISLTQQHLLSTDGVFINRVRQAGATIALEVMNEDPTGQGVGEYPARQQLAQRFIQNALQSAQRAAYVLATASPTVDPAAISDSQYLDFVRDNWSALAGYNPLYVAEAA